MTNLGSWREQEIRGLDSVQTSSSPIQEQLSHKYFPNTGPDLSHPNRSTASAPPPDLDLDLDFTATSQLRTRPTLHIPTHS